MTSPRLTAIVLVLNEADNLRALLPQLSWADETLVIDGGSTDESVAIAQSLGARTIRRPFDDFASQRNAALAEARGEWALYIDADERPSSRLADEIRRRIGADGRQGYRVPIRSTIFGRRFRFSGTQDDAPLRLVARRAGSWSGAVHERFSAEGAVGLLDSHLEHFTLPTVPAFLGKMQRYTTLAAEARVRDGSIPRAADAWLRPLLELFRRLIWKHGWLDGPQGWAFCGLSALSEWSLANKHRRRWRAASSTASTGNLERGELYPALALTEGGVS